MEIRRVFVHGGSHVCVIPKRIARRAAIGAGTLVAFMTAKNGDIVMRKVRYVESEVSGE